MKAIKQNLIKELQDGLIAISYNQGSSNDIDLVGKVLTTAFPNCDEKFLAFFSYYIRAIDPTQWCGVTFTDRTLININDFYEESYTIDDLRNNNLQVKVWSLLEANTIAKYNGFKQLWDPCMSDFPYYVRCNKTEDSFKDGCPKFTRSEDYKKGYKTIEYNQIVFIDEQDKPIGYLAPFNMFDNAILKGDLFTFVSNSKYAINNRQDLTVPKEIVETWDPVYKPKLTLPKISHYAGSVDGEFLCYGCSRILISAVLKLNEALNKFNANSSLPIARMIIEDTSGNGFSVTIDELKQIVNYITDGKN